MKYRFRYNECDSSQYDERFGDADIPSAKAVRDTLVEERDGKILKSRRQKVAGREYVVCAEFGFSEKLSPSDLLKQVIDRTEDAKNLSA